MSDNITLNYNDMYLAGLKFGYEDYVAITRHKLSTDGPIVQYADTSNENSTKILLPAKEFKNNAEQLAIYEQKLLGEGFDTTSFKTSKQTLKPSFEIPILCNFDNVPGEYVFDIFDLTKKSVYGDTIEHAARVSSVSGTTVVFSSSAKYLLKFLKESLQNGHNLYLRISDGLTLKSITSFIEITNISANNSTVTLSSSTNLAVTDRFLIGVFIFYKTPSYPVTPDLPSNISGHEYSNEFYLHSSRDGTYFPCLINSVSFNIDSQMPAMSISTVSKRLASSNKLILPSSSMLNNSPSLYSVPKCEQARIKITSVSGKTVFYGIFPVVHDQSLVYNNDLFNYKSGIHFGQDESNLSSPSPLMIRSMSLSIDNGLTPIYSTHTPRFSFTSGEEFINDLGRFDNMCPYGFYSTQRKISGNISIYVPQESWFEKEFLPAINSNTEGTIEIDTGYINFELTGLVFNLSAKSTQISNEYVKEANFSFISNSYQAMFEVGLSKTGGRL